MGMRPEPAGIVAVGVALEISATVCGTCGKQMVSFAARMPGNRRSRILMAIGLSITTFIGPIADASAYAFAPQALVAPFNGLDVCWNTLSAPFTLGERTTWRHIVGSLLVTVGAALTSLFGPHNNDEDTIDALLEKLLTKRVLAYVFVCAAFLASCLYMLRVRPAGNGDKLRGMALGAIAGCISGNMSFVSITMGLLRESVRTGDWSPWYGWPPIPYAFMLCASGVAVLQVPFMAKALLEYEAVFIVTLFEGFHIVVACASGSIVLLELDGLPAGQVAAYWASVLVICTGLFVIQTTSVAGIGQNAAPPSVRSTAVVPDEEISNGDWTCVPSNASNHGSGHDRSRIVWAGSFTGLAAAGNAGSDACCIRYANHNNGAGPLEERFLRSTGSSDDCIQASG